MRSLTPGETTVLLPGGLAVTEDRCLRRVALHPLTGYAEDWLAQSRDLPNAVKVTQVLAGCVTSFEDQEVGVPLMRKLLVGDRDFLMLQLRAATLGDRVQAVLPCPACTERMDIEFAVDEVPVEVRPQSAPAYSLALNGRTVRFRLPSGEDQEAVLGFDFAQAASELLRRCLLDDGGTALDDAERESIAAEMERLAPRVELELDLTCPECGHAFAAPFDTTAFFFEEMKGGHESLLREVHTLAFHYHWNERDILDLGRGRRRAYLELLSEALRRE
jgi:hypothetical protein